MATFDNLWETFPDENCVLTNREILVEVRRKPLHPSVNRDCGLAIEVHVNKIK